MAGQEGFEPPARGFGDRCSTVRATVLHYRKLLSLSVNCNFIIPRTKLFQFKTTCSIFLVFRSSIVTTLTLSAGKQNINSHDYSNISETTPAPTVRPPSRIAKRKPCSIAIGTIRSTVNTELSPGIIISTPSGRAIIPVTSVVRK